MSCTRYASMASLRRAIVEGREPAWLGRHPRASYIRQAVLSAPPWVWQNHRDELLALRDLARSMCKVGEDSRKSSYTLDHDVPLNHPYVCGLTVPWNLLVAPRGSNLSKGNRWNPHQASFDF